MRVVAFYHHILVLLNTWYLASEARLPYIKSSGYYTPYPPKETSVIYEFQPLRSASSASSAAGNSEDSVSKSRATRDLAWREFDSFLNGNEEPSCADLRRMWRLARELQQEASNLESNEISSPKQMHHPFKSYSVDKSSQELEPEAEAASAASQSNKELQRRKFSSNDDDKEVYGIVKTHAPPPQAPQVRDPTKEILSGLYRSSTSRPRPRPQPYYGRVIDREPVEKPPSSNFQLLRQELFGAPSNPRPEDKSPVYGTVHRFAPNEKSSSQLDRVRSLLAQEEGNEVNEQSKNAFDRIRDRLLKSTRKKLHRTRNLRRKGSKKRRRNAEEIAVIKERLLNDYVNTMPQLSSFTEEEKKRRRRNRQKNRKNKNLKKWRVSRDKLREQNLLLKKLGK